MRLIKAGLFTLALLIAVELGFRVYLYGPAAMIPTRMDSFTQIHTSGLVRAAAQPGIYYELQPELDTWYKGVPFTTNSAGLRDAEYALAKPAGTFRIVVLGSSWSMGSGVAGNRIWHAHLEEWLNAPTVSASKSDTQSPKALPQIEIINFAVDQYGFGEIVATLKHKALAYQPDLVLISLTHYTADILWEQPPPDYIEQDKRHPFFDLHALRFIDFRLQTGLMQSTGRSRKLVTDPDVFDRQIAAAINRIDSLTARNNIPFVFVDLSFRKSWSKSSTTMEDRLRAVDPDIGYISVKDALRSSGHSPGQLRVSVWDSHPSELAHELMAEAIAARLSSGNLLPAGL